MPVLDLKHAKQACEQYIPWQQYINFVACESCTTSYFLLCEHIAKQHCVEFNYYCHTLCVVGG